MPDLSKLQPKAVLQLYSERSKHYSAMHTAMIEFREVYEGRITIDLPEMDRMGHSTVPNLAAQGVDQMAGRMVSAVPQYTFAPVKGPGLSAHDQEKRAREAARVVAGWREADRFDVKQMQRAKHLTAYGMAPEVVRWNDRLKRPTFEVRNPLETFASPETVNGTTVPTDCLFSFRRSVGWLQDHGYGNQVSAVMGGTYWGSTPNRDLRLQLIEYICEYGRALYLTGSAQQPTEAMYPATFTGSGAQRIEVLEFAPIEKEYVCVTIPTRIGLDQPGGQFYKMLGMLYQAARLQALEVIAIEKGIFPDIYLESRQGEIGRIVDGPYDGRTGEINVIAGGIIRELTSQPGYMTTQIIDRLERAERVTTGLPSEFGGESGTNIRTGRRGDAVMAAVLDVAIAEAQTIFKYALEDSNRIAINLAKMNDGDNERTLYVGQGNEFRSITYTANKVFPTSEHRVTYPIVGADVNTMLIGLEQRKGSGTMSTQTVMTLDPWIADPEAEHDRMISEALELAVLGGLQTQAAAPPGQGTLPLTSLAKIEKLVRTDKAELIDAFQIVMAEAEAAQQGAAAGAPPGPGGMAPAEAAATQQGLGNIPGATTGQEDLASLFGKLRAPQMTIQPASQRPGGV